MTSDDDRIYVKDPLQITISVSSREIGVGDHPLKHWDTGVTRNGIIETICNPYKIYGHQRFPDRCNYVRHHYLGDPDPMPKDPAQNMLVAVVEYTGPNEGKVVTAHYTDYLSEKSVDIEDVKYDADKEHKKSHR